MKILRFIWNMWLEGLELNAKYTGDYTLWFM